MRRRDIVALIGSAVLAGPLALRAQQSEHMRRIGMLMAYPETDSLAQSYLAVFRTALRNLGWTEGDRLSFIERWATSDVEQIKRSAAELVSLQPDLILSSGTPTTAALAKDTSTIPILFTVVVDPIGGGWAASMARPGGNITGFTNLDPNTAGKWLELLKAIAPAVARVLVPYNPASEPYFELYLRPFREAAFSLDLEIIAAPVRDVTELEATITDAARVPNTGIVPMPGAFSNLNRVKITTLASRFRVPAVYPTRIYVESNGLLSYGNDNADNYRRAASYADRILRGEKPGELPIQFPEKFELVINLKTAKALGISIPAELLARADQVIE